MKIKAKILTIISFMVPLYAGAQYSSGISPKHFDMHIGAYYSADSLDFQMEVDTVQHIIKVVITNYSRYAILSDSSSFRLLRQVMNARSVHLVNMYYKDDGGHGRKVKTIITNSGSSLTWYFYEKEPFKQIDVQFEISYVLKKYDNGTYILHNKPILFGIGRMPED